MVFEKDRVASTPSQPFYAASAPTVGKREKSLSPQLGRGI